MHYLDPALRLPDIAGAAHLGVDHFGRLFRRETGDTPMQFPKKVRLKRGPLLLQDTGLHVAEIARGVGLCDPLHFSREFRRTAGSSPRSFRHRFAGGRD